MRRAYDYFTVKGVHGINQQVGAADVRMELLDARNVWAPDGVVVSRPGYVGVAVPCTIAQRDYFTSCDVLVENPIGTFTDTNTLNSLPTGSRWYLLWSDNLIASASYPSGLVVSITTANSNAVTARAEYWNGTTWAPLHVREKDVVSSVRFRYADGHLSDTAFLTVPLPVDLASTTVGGGGVTLTGYAVRFTVQAQYNSTTLVSDTTLDASTSVNTSASNCGYLSELVAQELLPRFLYLFVAKFASSKRYIAAARDVEGVLYSVSPELDGPVEASHSRHEIVGTDAITFSYANNAEPASLAVVPQFEEAYVARGHMTAMFSPNNAISDIAPHALVETSPALVGSGAPYDLNGDIQSLASWPQSNYIAFFRGEMWAANLSTSPYEVRWSAPVPAYKVWPVLNQAYIIDQGTGAGENSPITGLRGFQQHMHVFTNDSIWRMVDTGISDFDLQTYAAERVSVGIGVVSNSSVAEIRNRLVFLAEDGVYAYDGTSNVQKLSERIQDIVNRITPGRRANAQAAHWRKKHCYLLAVSLDGAEENNHVLVYDYKNDAWWVWDNIEVRQWVCDESASDDETIYFVDSRGRVFELGPGKVDNGAAMESYIITHEVGFDGNTRRLRSVEVDSTNKSRSLALEVYRNGEPEGDGTSATITLTDEAEVEYGEATSTSKYVRKRDRLRRIGFLKDGERFNCKVTQSTKNALLEVNEIKFGFMPLGRRK